MNLRSFNQKVRYNKKAFKKFLGQVEKKPPKNLHEIVDTLNAEVWQETDCLACANCCKRMSPTFTEKDIKRAASFLQMKPQEFKDKWLYVDKVGDWMNFKQPCQFLDLATNMCSIYEARPADCSGFPHLTKKKVVDYIHVHQQNVEYCPATYKMVEKMMAVIK